MKKLHLDHKKNMETSLCKDINMFKKILIANRGEIAFRVLRACKDLNIKTVGIYSEVDKSSLPLKYFDEIFSFNSSELNETYLNIENIIDIALKSNCDAIHPGYGFLSENKNFVKKCNEEGIIFIGPNSKAMANLGDKVNAKKLTNKLGISNIPGSSTVVKNIKDAFKVASDIGFPLIIKAAGGGGGRGMRLVKTEDDLENVFEISKSESKAAFGNANVYFEKYIEGAKHIEVQILGDKYGNLVHFFERDCTIQRKYQKLIEEAPAYGIKNNIKEKIWKSAIQLAEYTKYDNIGTIEFLLDKNGDHYFMESNTRIQVEHPITEMITGFDLVKEQIKVAYGKEINYNQKDIKINGHAIECRIYAEDPWNNFMPNPGKINSYVSPGGYGIRIDSAVYEGYEIPSYYDTLISKVIAWGKNRKEALSRMNSALEEYQIIGITNTKPLHLGILNDLNFKNNNFDTRYLESHINDLLPPQHDEFKFIISAVLNEHLNKSKFSSIRQNLMSSPKSRKKRIGDAWNTWRKKSR